MSLTEPATPLGPGRPQQDIPALTSVRFFAALGVVLFHYAAPIESWLRGLGAGSVLAGRAAQAAAVPLAIVRHDGFLGVSLFFVLSGFILTHVYLGQDASRVERRRFWLARVARIYPVYLLGFLGCAPFVVLGTIDRYGSGGAVAHLLLAAVPALLLAHGWICAWVPLWNFPSWSVGAEALFYLLFPWLAPALARVRRRRRVLTGAVLWAAGMALPLAYLGASKLAAPGDVLGTIASWSDAAGWQRLVLDAPIFHVHEFALGILTARIFAGRDRNRSHADRWTLLGVATTVILCAGMSAPLVILGDGLLAPAFACVIYGLACGGRIGSWLASRPLVVLGEASYALYVLQSPLFDLLTVGIKSARPDLQLTAAGRALTAGVIVLTMLMVSILVARGIEQPARRWILRRFAARPGLVERSPAPVPS